MKLSYPNSLNFMRLVIFGILNLRKYYDKSESYSCILFIDEGNISVIFTRINEQNTLLDICLVYFMLVKSCLCSKPSCTKRLEEEKSTRINVMVHDIFVFTLNVLLLII